MYVWLHCPLAISVTQHRNSRIPGTSISTSSNSEGAADACLFGAGPTASRIHAAMKYY